MQTKRSQRKVRTTLGELAAACYEVALAELRNERLAARLAERMVFDVLRTNQVRIAHA